MPLISIIIPVFKVEKYIRECIESVINQSFIDWEMILVDDGSPDNCPNICDEYAQKDYRIKVVHQKNGGLSLARNTGMHYAKGKYLYFIDSDDLLPNNALQRLVETGNEFNWPEYIKGCHYVLMPNGNKVLTRNPPPQCLCNQLLASECFMSNVILCHPLVWNGLINRAVLIDNNICFQKDAFPREDLIFHLDLARLHFNGVYTLKPTYVYRYAVANSLSNSITKRSIANHVPIIKAIINSKSSLKDDSVIDYAIRELTNTLNSFFKCLIRLERKERNHCLQIFKDEIGDIKLLSNNLSFFPKIYSVSPRIYSILANTISCILPQKYKIYE